MLLSLYLLYRYAKSGKSWSYTLDIGLFVVLVSLVSTMFPLTEMAFYWPLTFVSFPFYFWCGELAAPVWLASELRYTHPWLYYHSVRFLTVDLNLTPDWELSGGQIISYSPWSNYNNALVIAFSVFLLVNLLGAALGYVIGKKREFTIMSEERWAIVGVASAAAGFLLLFGSFFPMSGPRTQMAQVAGFLSIPFLGFGNMVLGVLAFSVLIDYVKRARVTTLMVMAGLVLFIAGNAANHVLMSNVGQTLVVFGGIVYFLRLFIAYARAHPPPASPETPTQT